MVHHHAARNTHFDLRLEMESPSFLGDTQGAISQPAGQAVRRTFGKHSMDSSRNTRPSLHVPSRLSKTELRTDTREILQRKHSADRVEWFTPFSHDQRSDVLNNRLQFRFIGASNDQVGTVTILSIEGIASDIDVRVIILDR